MYQGADRQAQECLLESAQDAQGNHQSFDAMIDSISPP